MTQTKLEIATEIAKIIRGTALSQDLFQDNKFVFEHKERIYSVTMLNDDLNDDLVMIAKYTGLESEIPQIIYRFTAPYNYDAFVIMIKHFNKLYP